MLVLMIHGIEWPVYGHHLGKARIVLESSHRLYALKRRFEGKLKMVLLEFAIGG